MCKKQIFQWANPGLFIVYFCSFQTQILYKDFSRIRTRIIRVDGEHADHMTGTTTPTHQQIFCQPDFTANDETVTYYSSNPSDGNHLSLSFCDQRDSNLDHQVLGKQTSHKIVSVPSIHFFTITQV